jgi:hypothetical protein
MKKFFILSAALVLFGTASLSAQSQRIVRLKPGFSTVIVSPAPPDLVTIGSPEDYAIQNSGNFILVKPLVTRGSTNMFIKVGAESYHLILSISDTPDLEVRLAQTPLTSKNPSPSNGSRPGNGNTNTDKPSATVKLSATRDLRPVLAKARSILPAYLRTPRRYTYSIKDSDVILALDYMVQIQDKLFVLCTLVNSSNIPYDVGYVRFKLIDQARSFIFFKKKIKESELEPIREVYKQRIHPNTASRMVFIFDKHGFSDRSKLQIKCIEESGRRDLVLEVPASYVE